MDTASGSTLTSSASASFPRSSGHLHSISTDLSGTLLFLVTLSQITVFSTIPEYGDLGGVICGAGSATVLQFPWCALLSYLNFTMPSSLFPTLVRTFASLH